MIVLVQHWAIDGELSSGERHSGFVGIKRRLFVRGLKNSDVTFLPELPGGKVLMSANDTRPERSKSIPFETADGGRRLIARNLTGELQISW